MRTCCKIKDITTNKEYSSISAMLIELGMKAPSARVEYRLVKKNIIENNGIYKKSNHVHSDSVLNAIDGHNFELIEYVQGLNDADNTQVEDHMRYTPRPRKADAINYADGDKVNTRMFITKFRFIKDDLKLDINTNDIAVVCETTGMIYPSIRNCVDMVGYNLTEEQKKVLYSYIRKSCRTKRVVAVEKNRNDSASFMSKYEGLQFKYLTDFGCRDFGALKKNYCKSLYNNLEEAEAEKAKISKTIIQLRAELDGWEEIERLADTRISMYSELLKKK